MSQLSKGDVVKLTDMLFTVQKVDEQSVNVVGFNYEGDWVETVLDKGLLIKVEGESK